MIQDRRIRTSTSRATTVCSAIGLECQSFRRVLAVCLHGCLLLAILASSSKTFGQAKSSRRVAVDEVAVDKIAVPKIGVSKIGVSKRPNLILINLDDADVDIFSDDNLERFLPNLNRMASEGLRFTNCHVGIPLCGPSRTCLLRGQHPHRTGVKTNVHAGPMNNGFTGAYDVFKARGYESEHIGIWMQRAGYRTMMIGKYLHGRMNPEGVPGWDDWLVCYGGNYFGVSRYLKRLEQDQRRRKIDDSIYRTVYEADEAIHMIESQVQRNADLDSDQTPQPFFLYIAPLAPHKPAGTGKMLQPKYLELGKDIRLADTPDLNEEDVTDKPEFLQITKLKDTTMQSLHEEHRKRVVSTKSVDDMVGRISETLKSNNLTDNTYIFFTSDHGYQLGHSRMIAKKVPYHRNTVIPMFVSGPDVAPGKSDQLLLQIDLIPTFLEFANYKAPVPLDGSSIRNLMTNHSKDSVGEFRKSILIQNWEEKSQRGNLIPASFASLRMHHEIYTEWSNGELEYYNLETDPYQLENKIASTNPAQRTKWSRELHLLKQGDTKPIATLSTPELISKNTLIRGFAEDDQAVSAVNVVLHDPKSKTYWTGQAWKQEETSVKAEIANPGGLITNWATGLDLATIGNNGELKVFVQTSDMDGNESDWIAQTFKVDAIEPKVLLKLPAADTEVASPTILFGTCGDNQQLRGVELTLENLDDETFWNGAAWVKSKTTFFKRVAGERWHVELDLPLGKYHASARALDRAGNYSQTPSETRFTVSENPKQ